MPASPVTAHRRGSLSRRGSHSSSLVAEAASAKPIDHVAVLRAAKELQRRMRGRIARKELAAVASLERLEAMVEMSTAAAPQREGTSGDAKAKFGKSPKRAPKAGQKGKGNEQSSVGQTSGDLGVARMVDDIMQAPLIYRLVALDSTKAWGKGKLVLLAEKRTTESELAGELHALLRKPWEEDPIRQRFVRERKLEGRVPSIETWADVLLDGRGTVGETVLHLAFLLNSPACRRLIHFLVPYLADKQTIDAFGHRVGALDATYLGQPYYGEVAAHFAIVHDDLPMLKLLVEHGANLSARAVGDFFYSNRLLYFGGTLLGFAACLDSKPIVEYLLTNEHRRANPNGRDLGPESERGHNAPKRLPFQRHMIRDNTILHVRPVSVEPKILRLH